ncbi:cell division topological specificity factor MinE [Thioclava sp. FTW29]|uniref:Cell division topological specificity factor n=1 Tax=Thioclava litoralis TaxID=3076557 RepID=A0ABZ1E2G7_9RHOB|nr:cell division topological specificity factor MinE [Thioclava sp. FTW29]
MSLFGFSLKPRRKQTANAAKERLQILLAHERGSNSSGGDYLPQLQRDIIAVIRKYVEVADEEVDIRMERGDDIESLEINIEMPSKPAKADKA